MKNVSQRNKYAALEEGVLIVDARPAEEFKAGHLSGAINIMDGGKFETWLGSVIGPEEEFYLIAENNEALEGMFRKCAKIGYEKNVKGAMLNPAYAEEQSPAVDPKALKASPE